MDDLITRHAQRDATDALILRQFAVSLRATIAMLRRVEMQTDEGAKAMRELIRQATDLAEDASADADEADERAQAIIERNAA